MLPAGTSHALPERIGKMKASIFSLDPDVYVVATIFVYYAIRLKNRSRLASLAGTGGLAVTLVLGSTVSVLFA